MAPIRGSRKRKPTADTDILVVSASQEAVPISVPDATAVSQEAVPISVPDATAVLKQASEYHAEKRNLEDLWQACFPVGTEWENMDRLNDYNWKFSNLEEAFEKGGVLYGETVYLFRLTEADMLAVNGDEEKMTLIPIIVAAVSPVPPSNKIGITSVQREKEDIVPMKAMKMAWTPYIPVEDRETQVEKFNARIFTLTCNQRRSALKHLKIDRIKLYDYCHPYRQSFESPKEETIVDILYPLEPPLVERFDWKRENLEDFIEELVNEETLPSEHKDDFKNFVSKLIEETKKTQQKAREAKEKAITDLSPETRAALAAMKVYKFYPVQTPDTPKIAKKVKYINRYYGKAIEIL